MPDAAEQPGDELNLEDHLEALLGEIEATRVKVEGEPVRSDAETPEPVTPTAEAPGQPHTPRPPEAAPDPGVDPTSAHEGDITSPSESETEPALDAGEASLDAIAEIEADLGDLVDAIYELENPESDIEPLTEAEPVTPENDETATEPEVEPEVAEEPEAEAEAEAAEPEVKAEAAVEAGAATEPEATEPEAAVEPDLEEADALAAEILNELEMEQEATPEVGGTEAPSDADDGFGLGIDDLAESVEQMLGVSTPAPAPTEPPESDADASQPVSNPDVSDTFEPAPEAANDAPPAESGDALDDMLAAASEELLASEESDPAPVETETPEPVEAEPADEVDAGLGEELMDAVEALADAPDPDESAAGVVEIPGVPAPAEQDAAPAAEPEPDPEPVASETPAPEAPEPAPAAREEFIAPKPEAPPPTGKLAPLILVWRWTARTMGRIGQRAAPALADAVLAVGKPLREKPKSVRDTVGWIALYTAFLAICLWIFALGFRSPSPPEVSDSAARVVFPEDGTPAAPVP